MKRRQESQQERTAEIVTGGGGQMVRLPEDICFTSMFVSVRRVGQGVLLEPLAVSATRPSADELRVRFASIDSIDADDILPHGRLQGVVEPEDFLY